MSKKNAKNMKVESLADRYSFGHKAISVALSVVLLGFGFPAVNPSEIYAAEEATQEAAQTAATQGNSQATDAQTAATQGDSQAAATQTQQADTSAADAAASAENNAVETQETPAAEESAPEGSSSEATTANEADVKLELNNGYITYKGQKEQKYALPATKATVSTKAGAEDFKFSATADEGYELNKVTVTVNGAETELTADADGIYTVALNDVIAGATVKLVTSKKADAATEESATEIATSDIVAPTSNDASKNKTTKNDSSESTIDKLRAFVEKKLNPNAIAITSLMGLDSGVETASLPEDTATDKYIYVGDSVTLTGTSGYNHSWTSSNNSVATVSRSDGSGWGKVSSTGTVTGVSEGDVTITHTYYTRNSTNSRNKKTETFTIHVVEKTPATGIVISGDTTVGTEDNIQLSATVSPEGAAYKSIAWSSSNKEVLTVDSNGKVTGVAEGTATVTAKLTNSDGST